MNRPRQDAEAIWNAGVDAVRAQPLVENSVEVTPECLRIGEHTWSREAFDRVIVVGGGKAATGMATGLVARLDNWLPLSGWINVPAGTERDVPGITVHVARPAGCNEPTEAGVAGTRQILRMVSEAGERDLVIVLLSGGGSALLPAPLEGISLPDQLEVIRRLSGAGADIVQLNTVRKHLSAIKGGGLLEHCRSSELITLILSDVLGDPLDIIASGPTVPDPSSPGDALAVLGEFDPDRRLPQSIYRLLESSQQRSQSPTYDHVHHLVIGNNATAVDEAGVRAEQLGYNHAMQSATECEGAAEQIGRHLAKMLINMLGENANQTAHHINCLITGGEPTVSLAPPEIRGRGGRNQQLVLAAYQELLQAGLAESQWDRLALLSGGTDGEDGPTDAAGAVICGEVHRQAQAGKLDVEDHLRRNDAYTFFDRAGGLLRSGPTGTNVCDLRVALVRR